MIERINYYLEFIEEKLGGILLFLSVLLIVFQVLMRSLFGYGLSGIYELATFFVVWSIILTAGLGIRRNVHVRVDILMHLVPTRIAFTLENIVCLIMGTVGVALAYSGWLLVNESLVFRDATLGTIRIPMWIPQFIMPIAGLLIVFHAAGRLVGLWRGNIPVLEVPEILPST